MSSVSRISILQSEANVARGVTSTEFLSDAPSENNSTGSSTAVPGQFIEWRGRGGRGGGDLNFTYLVIPVPASLCFSIEKYYTML